MAARKPDGKKCAATAKQTGKRCGQPSIPGGDVCVYHGGKAPQVQEAARKRLLEMADPALAAMMKLLMTKGEKTASVRLGAAKDILDRIGLGATQKIEGDLKVPEAEEFRKMLLEMRQLRDGSAD